MRLKYGAASLLALGACALAAPVMAQDHNGPPVIVPLTTAPPTILPAAPPRPSVVTAPRWVRQLMAQFPERAQSRGIEFGRVRLECTVSVESRLTDCRVLLEDPLGAGFAPAAMAGVPYAIVEPRTVDGVPVPARVTFNVDFRLEDPPAPEPEAQPWFAFQRRGEDLRTYLQLNVV